MKKTWICLIICAMLTFSCTPEAQGLSGTLDTADTTSSSQQADGKEKLPVVSVPPHWEERDGLWVLLDGEGNPVPGWYQQEGKWYLLSDQGVIQIGWRVAEDKWYYLDSEGVMVDGWQLIDGKWYLFSGGAMQTGWKQSGGKWYYFSDAGVMQTGWQTIGGKEYYLTSSGAMKTGLQTRGETVYTLGSSGAVSGSQPISALSNRSYGWGQGVQVDSLNRPIGATSYQDKFGKYDAYFVGPNTKTIYLTFDEGYENGYTAKILDTLKAKKCSAVFFVTMPYVKQNPDLVRRMIDEGHIVGNHSVNHKSMPTLSTETAAQEIIGLHNYVKENFGYEMTLFRPPMGEWSTRTLEIANRLHYKTILWSYAYLDYDVNNQMGVDKAFPKVTGSAHNGAVYLLHAVSKDNAEMLGDVIDAFRADGYTLKGLS